MQDQDERQPFNVGDREEQNKGRKMNLEPIIENTRSSSCVPISFNKDTTQMAMRNANLPSK